MKAESLITRRETLESVIYNELHDRIISLHYPPGTMIYENAIAEEFGVSRTPVRHAFILLANEELLKVLPQRGARISTLSVSKINEVQLIRESLEITAFAQVAEIWDCQNPQHQIVEKEVHEIIEQQKAAVQVKDYINFIKLDEDYHNAIIKVTENETLLSIVNDMRSHLNRVRYIELQEAHHEEEAIRFHEAIFEAVKRNDVELTKKRLRDHLKTLEEFREEIFSRHKSFFL